MKGRTRDEQLSNPVDHGDSHGSKPVIEGCEVFVAETSV